MSSFALDTSGHVRRPGLAKPLAWSDLDPFEQGYAEALLSDAPEPWGCRSCSYRGGEDNTNGVGNCPKCGHAYEADPERVRCFSDLADETLARIIADCADVLSLAAHAHLNTAAAGRVFWERRQAGRYDPKIAGPLTVTLGDDGKVYLAEVQS